MPTLTPAQKAAAEANIASVIKAKAAAKGLGTLTDTSPFPAPSALGPGDIPSSSFDPIFVTAQTAVATFPEWWSLGQLQIWEGIHDDHKNIIDGAKLILAEYLEYIENHSGAGN